jgi:hypothetical protein
VDNRFLKLVAGIAAFCLSQSSMATLLDFTDYSLVSSLSPIANGYSGTIDGIGFTLTSDDGHVNFDQKYDGSSNTGCLTTGGPLRCGSDGAGVTDDELTGIGVNIQALTLTFDSVVSLSGFYFLDLYVNPDGSGAKEQATISLDGTLFATVDATAAVGDGGYADLITAPVLAQSIQFTAVNDPVFWDDSTNDYAFAGVDVSRMSVPEPFAILLFGTGLAGLAGVSRFKKKNKG